MWRYYYILILVLLLSNKSVGQINSDGQPNSKSSLFIATESVYVNTTNSLVFTGEYLFYSVYCLNDKTKKLSHLSKVAYVELINNDGDRLFSHKLKLEGGRAYSEFFVPVEMQTGNYKLIAYTNWMQNKSSENIFVLDVNVINPYQTNRLTYWSKTDQAKYDIEQNIIQKNNIDIHKGFLEMEIDKSKYNKREKVSIKLNSANTSPIEGTYSLSVKKKNVLTSPTTKNIVDFKSNLKADSVNVYSLEKHIIKPELRGELFHGIIVPKSGTLKKGMKISLSIPGKPNYFRVVECDREGNFYFTVDKTNFNQEIYLQVLDTQGDYEIKLKTNRQIETSQLNFHEFKLNPEWRNSIINRSVNNQIENAYFNFKPDSIKNFSENDKLFENKSEEVYFLADYASFANIKEAIVEIVKKVSIKKLDSKTSKFLIQGYELETNADIPALVILNGIEFQNHDLIMPLNGNTIESITVYRDQFIVGTQVYQGAIIFKTLNNSSEFNLVDSSITKMIIERPRPKKDYFRQEYSISNQNSRIPDYRRQLLWIPNLMISDSSNLSINFFTSDVSGDYDVILEGFSSSGEPIFIKKSFIVN